jgi:hypothetical protein
MNIYDIDNIEKDESGIYDLTQLTFEYLGPDNLSTYTVQRGEEMRIDLVCQNLYNNTDYVDIILNINNIDNPLNIRVGDKLFYPNASDIQQFRFSEKKSDENINKLSNPNKATRKDSNRKNYIENNRSLPPTILKERINPFNLDEPGKIVLGQGFI